MPADAHVWLLEFEPDEEGWGRMPMAVCESLEDAFLSVDGIGGDPFTLTWALRQVLTEEVYATAPSNVPVFTAAVPGSGTWTVTRHAVRPAGSVRRRVLPPPPEATDGR